MEKAMLNINVDKIGEVAVIHCEGRIVRSEAAFKLRDAVTQQSDSRVILLDLSGVEALEGGGLGMLLFLQMWTRDHGIQLKAFDATDGVRQSLGRARYVATVEMAGVSEVLSLLGWEQEDLSDSSRWAA
jgi:anti-anti-sigma regulatory factor